MFITAYIILGIVGFWLVGNLLTYPFQDYFIFRPKKLKPDYEYSFSVMPEEVLSKRRIKAVLMRCGFGQIIRKGWYFTSMVMRAIWLGGGIYIIALHGLDMIFLCMTIVALAKAPDIGVSEFCMEMLQKSTITFGNFFRKIKS